MEDFKFSTGELHFIPSVGLSNIRINVLTEEDLLKLKVIAIDTSVTAIELGGDFTRLKDIPDIIGCRQKLGFSYSDIKDRFFDYIKNENTIRLIQLYEEKGEAEAIAFIDGISREGMGRLIKSRTEKEKYVTPPIISEMLNKAFHDAKAVCHTTTGGRTASVNLDTEYTEDIEGYLDAGEDERDI